MSCAVVLFYVTVKDGYHYVTYWCLDSVFLNFNINIYSAESKVLNVIIVIVIIVIIVIIVVVYLYSTLKRHQADQSAEQYKNKEKHIR